TLSTSSHSLFSYDPPPSELYTLSLHDALPISGTLQPPHFAPVPDGSQHYHHAIVQHRVGLDGGSQGCSVHDGHLKIGNHNVVGRSEEHTSELQSPCNLVCRLLLEKKKNKLKKAYARHIVLKQTVRSPLTPESKYSSTISFFSASVR